MIALLPALIAALPSIIGGGVKLAETVFPKAVDGVSMGEAKKDFVKDLVHANLQVLFAHDIFPKLLDENEAMVERVVDMMIEGAVALLKKEKAA